ncbi:MAG: CNNM domain-containing protein, partial [Acidobacteriota bacterium]|nr:CNNM domain-containing protein [Acidobacteriota bacterium]
MEAVGSKAFLLALSFFLVLLNGFYVAAEFALVKVRTSRLSELVAEGRPLAKTALWLARRLDQSLSACQLGITIASLGLGWIGEPAIARLLEPLLHAVGITSIALVHSISFTIAFSV